MANKKQKEPILPFLYIHFKQYSEGGEVCQGQENDAYPSREPIYHSYTYDYAKRSNTTGKDVWSCGIQTVKVTPEVFSSNKVFLAIVVYQDGGTFVTSHGHHEILGGYATRKEAEDVLALVNEEGIDITGHDGYCQWAGYFNRLEDKIVQKLDIED